VKGGDYTLETLDPDERAALESVGARIEIVGLVPGKSTTAVVQKMAGDVGAGALK
jgi:bifunctional ADP-heptose synthase (sugar kinase/adenylyltransferase)